MRTDTGGAVWQDAEGTPLCHLHSDMRQVISRLVLASYESRPETAAGGSRLQPPANVTARRGRDARGPACKRPPAGQGAGVPLAAAGPEKRRRRRLPVICFLCSFFNGPLQSADRFATLVISRYRVRFKNSLIQIRSQFRFQSTANSSSDRWSNVETFEREEVGMSGCLTV